MFHTTHLYNILMVELKQAATDMEPTIGFIAVIKNLIDNSRGGQKSEATIILGRTFYFAL